MSYEIRGLVCGKAESGAWKPLTAGLSLLPVVRAETDVPRYITADGDPILTLSDDLERLAIRLSHTAPVAYIEAEYFGGAGIQASLRWADGRQHGEPLLLDEESDLPRDQWPINQALRFLGVSADGAQDEFDTVDLGRHRSTTDW